MLMKGTLIKIKDNTGALTGEIFCIYKGSNPRKAIVGDIVKVAIKTVQPNTSVKKGQKFKALIVSTVYPTLRKDGVVTRGPINAGILLDESAQNLMGSTISIEVAREAVEGKNAKFKKAASISKGVY